SREAGLVREVRLISGVFEASQSSLATQAAPAAEASGAADPAEVPAQTDPAQTGSDQIATDEAGTDQTGTDQTVPVAPFDYTTALRRIDLAPGVVAFIFDADGAILATRTGPESDLVANRPTVITDFLNSVWDGVSVVL